MTHTKTILCTERVPSVRVALVPQSKTKNLRTSWQRFDEISVHQSEPVQLRRALCLAQIRADALSGI